MSATATAKQIEPDSKTTKQHGAKRAMPLSPHLFIYKPQITSVLSILHRIAGVIDFIGLLTFAWWVLYIAYYGRDYNLSIIYSIWSHPIGQVAIFAWTMALAFHFCTGIRYLFWGIGLGFNQKTVTITGIMAVIASFSITLLMWSCYLFHN